MILRTFVYMSSFVRLVVVERLVTFHGARLTVARNYTHRNDVTIAPSPAQVMFELGSRTDNIE